MARGTVTVRVLGDARGLTEELNKTSNRMRKFGDAMSATVTPALALLGKASVDAASDLDEAANKVDVVFGGASSKVQKFADNASTSIGLSARAALDGAGAFGNMFNTIGVAASASADMSTAMVQLATDMASFNNEDPSDMLDRLRSGLAGEAEPLRRFGVLLSAAAVQSHAVEAGIAAAGEELTEAEKVQARYSLILEQTTVQQGDFARTSEGLANQQRILTAEFEDARAEIGEALLPVMTSMAGVALDVLETFNALPKGAQNAAVGFGVLVAGVGPAISAITRLKGNMTSLVGLLARGGPWGLAAAAAVAGIGLLAKSHIDARRRVEDYTNAIEADSGALGENTRATVENSIVKDELYADLARLGISTEQFIDAVLDSGSAAAEVGGIISAAFAEATPAINDAVTSGGSLDNAMQRMDESNDDLWASVNRVSDALGRERGAMEDAEEAARRQALAVSMASEAATEFREILAGSTTAGRNFAGQLLEGRGALDAATAATDGTAGATDDLAEAADDAAREVSTLTERLQILSGVNLDVDRAMINYRGTLADVTDELAEGSRSLDVNTEAGRTNRATLIELIEESFNLVGAMEAEGATAAEVEVALQSHVGDLRDVMAQAGFTEEQIAGLIDQYNLTPDEVHTAVFASGVQATVDDLHRVRVAMGEVGDSIESVSARLNLRVAGISVPANYSPGSGDGPGMAAGPRINISGGHGQGDGPGLEFGHEFLSHISDIVIKEMPALGMLQNNVGYQAMMNALRGIFPGLPLISGFRPGAITATGNPSYHGMGRAVDIPPDMRVFNAIANSPVAGITKELIFSPAGNRQIHNGRNKTYGEPTRGDHWDHIHFALANGGIVRATPGGTSAILGEGGSDEAVIPLDRPLSVFLSGASDAAVNALSFPGGFGRGAGSGIPGGHVRPTGPPNLNPGGVMPHMRGPSGPLLDEINANAEMLRIEALPAAERLAEVKKRMADLEAVGLKNNNEYVDLLREAEKLQADIARQTAAAVSAMQNLVERSRAAAAAPLIAQRDDYQRMLDGLIRDRKAASDQLVRLEEQYAADVLRIQQDLADRTQSILDERMRQLVEFHFDATGGPGGGEIPFLLGFGKQGLPGGAAGGASSLLAQLRAANKDLADMGAILADLRGQGLDEDVIRLLGLDSPQQMDLLRDLSGSTVAEIDELNRLVVERHRLAGAQVATEQEGLLGTMGAALGQLQGESAAAMAGVTEAFEGASNALAVAIEGMSVMIAALIADINRMNDEIEAIETGTPTGRPNLVPGDRGDAFGGGGGSTGPWGAPVQINVTAPNPRSAATETAAELRAMELRHGWGGRWRG